MQLHLSTWQEVERYLETSRGILVPIGSTEQHGPTGLIGTDAICAEVICRRVGEAEGVLVAPTIPVGMAEHHMCFTGTITYRPSTLIRVICDYVSSLARHGFERMLFVNGHGGNIATINAAFYEAYGAAARRPGANAASLRCRLVNWWTNDKVKAISEELFGDREGSHATASEISVTQYAYRDHIKKAPLDPPLAPSGGFYGAEDFRRRFPDGRIGSDPALSTPEHGARLVAAAADAIVELYNEFMAAD
ncbi:MAG: creatininase family protein [Alphaproteobacteria bacterium]